MGLKRPAEDDPSSAGKVARAKIESSGTLAFPSHSHPASHPPAFQRPSQLLTFSYSPSRVLQFDDSALRYFVDPPRGADLNHGYANWIRRPEERGRIDGLLSAWSRFKKSIQGQNPDIGVISWRGVMTKILTAPYEESVGWELNVMCVDGTMYFEEHLSDAKLKEKNDMTPRHRLQSYYGYSFESYCTSPTPSGHEHRASGSSSAAGWGDDVDTNVQWCSVVKTKLGDTRIIIGGEVDCIRGKYAGNTDNFVELKTSLSIRGAEDEAKFEKKLLKFYFQSFLLGVPEVFVGFRKPSGYLTTTQVFQTVQIPRLVRGKPGAWNPNVCLAWGDQFLSFLKNTIRGGSKGDVWRIKFMPKTGVSAALLDDVDVKDVEGGEDRVGLLPRWYWEAVVKDSAVTAQTRSEGASSKVGTVLVPSGWKI
ncbi:RAI1-domain-containing protein [Suillus paluster]|uniref:RAI1-domain-containing protein n=1 Tax=Suillus paluster TaxID=48578 RepID=UPI001B86BF24|nr:RAI1-domain-containing protein [Suillus paluster]KAG1737120.1 RAI1-domain-containing protein [Suillus paluster]